MKEKKQCKTRVWDNGDMDSCGKETYALGLCSGHFDRHKAELERHQQELLDELKSVNQRLYQIDSLCLGQKAD
jgi:hypothetical protein